MGNLHGKILFVCLHGSAKSLIAAEYFNRLAAARPGREGSVRGHGADDAIPPRVAQGLRDDGVEIGDRRPDARCR